MRIFSALGVASLTFLFGCEAGTTEIGTPRIVSFTPGYPSGEGCALFSDGAALCRGGNGFGQLGIGTAVDDQYLLENEIRVDASVAFKAIAVGATHTCALDDDGAAWCWGWNGVGSLGVADTTGPEQCEYTYGWPTVSAVDGCSTRPVKVATALRFTAIYADVAKSCGLTLGRELWCWGAFAADRFGRGAAVIPAVCSAVACPVPVRAAPGLTFKKIVMREYGTCGIADDLHLNCWGEDFNGRFGRELGIDPGSEFPTPINSSAAIGDVALSFSHTCTVTTAGALMCFGGNSMGQLGDSTRTDRQTPLERTPSTPFRRISVTESRSCALDETGKAWCWGDNRSGELGLGHQLPALVPGRVLGDLSFRSLQVGSPICAAQSKTIWCWGQLPSRFEQ